MWYNCIGRVEAVTDVDIIKVPSGAIKCTGWHLARFHHLIVTEGIFVYKDCNMTYRDEHFGEIDATYVYVIESTSGHFKIGITNDPDRRMNQLSPTKGPFEFDFVCKTPYPTRRDALDKERWLHDIYQDQRVNGEWFQLSSTDLMSIGYMLLGDQVKYAEYHL